MPEAIVIDTDPGVDDAVAIALAARRPQLRIELVTTVAGNVELPRATANATALLHRLGCDDVPVAAGAGRGMVRRKGTHPAVHGADGLGGVTLTPAARDPLEVSAVRALATRLRRAPERSLTLVAIAPLTNLALLLGAEPGLARRLRRVVIMGGAGGPGNVTPYAEYNVWADPEAAARVFDEDELDLLLVPLEVTRRATLGRIGSERLRGRSTLGSELARMIDGYGDGTRHERPLHDAVALAAVLDPTLLATEPATVRVDTSTGASRGATTIRIAPPPPAGTRLRVAVELDVERWRRCVIDGIVDA